MWTNHAGALYVAEPQQIGRDVCGGGVEREREREGEGFVWQAHKNWDLKISLLGLALVG